MGQATKDPRQDRSHRRTETARLLAEAGDAPDEVRARLEEEVVRFNMGVAGEIARRYHGRGVGNDDLDQVAYLGLVKAVRGFDPEPRLRLPELRRADDAWRDPALLP